jgi:RNA polymerase sigma-70 factor, ECF subfamily
LVYSEDEILIARVKADDKEAFSKLILKYQGKAFNIAYRMLDNYEEAKDVTQAAFIRAYQGLGSFREDSCFYTWLYRIIINLCKNKKKSWAIHPPPESLDEPVATEEGEVARTVTDKEPAPDEIAVRHEIQELVQKAINGLPVQYKEIIILRDIEGLSYEEIAEALSCREGTVKSRLCRARIMLKDKLEELHPFQLVKK